ncbi:unnamed protein product, partial [Staurois parvus]
MGRNSAPSLVSVSVGRTVPHRWCQWGEQCPIVGVSGGGTVPHCWCQWGRRNSAPSLVSVG